MCLLIWLKDGMEIRHTAILCKRSFLKINSCTVSPTRGSWWIMGLLWLAVLWFVYSNCFTGSPRKSYYYFSANEEHWDIERYQSIGIKTKSKYNSRNTDYIHIYIYIYIYIIHHSIIIRSWASVYIKSAIFLYVYIHCIMNMICRVNINISAI